MATLAPPKKRTNVLFQFYIAGLRIGFRVGSWLLPKLTLHRAFRLFGTPLPGGRIKALHSPTEGAALREVAFGREHLQVYTWGDPQTQPTVLLAHGWASYGLFFLPWVRQLRAAGYAVVSLDQPAHGRSSGLRATLPMFADALGCIAQQLPPLAAVVGHSLGGAAVMIALSRGMRAERVVLLAPAADPIDAARRFGNFVGLPQHLSEQLFDDFEAVTGLSVSGFQAHRNAPFIGRPALVVHDVEDRDVPWSEGERYARYWPAARLLSTTGLGHNRLVSDSEVVDQALAFLQGREVGERVVSTTALPFGWA